MVMNLAGVGQTVLLIGIVMFGLGTLFSFITLPVEYDASNRALAWLKTENIVTPQEYEGSKDSLKWYENVRSSCSWISGNFALFCRDIFRERLKIIDKNFDKFYIKTLLLRGVFLFLEHEDFYRRNPRSFTFQSLFRL